MSFSQITCSGHGVYVKSFLLNVRRDVRSQKLQCNEACFVLQSVKQIKKYLLKLEIWTFEIFLKKT